MDKIKFGTDGWRAIIAKDYTIENVKRVAEASAKWMLQRDMTKVVIGYDARFGGKMFAESAATVYGHYGMKVFLSSDFVSTPMVSLGIVKLKADLGVVITASHNPPSYNGFKLKSSFGGPTIPSEIAEVEALIADSAMPYLPSMDDLVAKNLLEYVDLEQIYYDHCEANFNLDAIKNSSIKLVYDAMYGAGQRILPRLLPNATLLGCEFNPWFNGCPPEPIDRNLTVLSGMLASSDHNLGLANDGDADRIGMYDENGKFVDSHHLLLLLLHYMVSYKKMTGKVIITFSVTDKMKKLAEHYGLDIEVTKIGFKYIAEIMIHEDVVVGGEESGGLAVKGHIPERDGIWMGLMIMEFMAATGKSILELIEEVYAIVGPFAVDRDDLHLTEEKKLEVLDRCKNNLITTIGDRPIIKTETIDGYKYYLSDEEWVMIRPSGTEPVLRIYSQAADLSGVRKNLADTHAMINN